MGEYKTEPIPYCTRCGVATSSQSGRISEADGNFYCAKCAEEVNREYLAKSTCAICGRTMSKDEVKFVLPSKSFGAKEVRLYSRLACVQCYSTFASKAENRHLYKSERHRMLMKSAKRQLIRQVLEHA